MGKSLSILGLIAGIIGILSCGALLFTARNTPLGHAYVNDVLFVYAIALNLQIIGLMFAIQGSKNSHITGIIMIIAGISDLIAGVFSIVGDNPASCIACFVVFILFLVAGISEIKTVQKTV